MYKISKLKIFPRVQKWLRAILREDYTPSPNSAVCTLHFRAPDFISESQTKDKRRSRQRLSKELLRRDWDDMLLCLTFWIFHI